MKNDFMPVSEEAGLSPVWTRAIALGTVWGAFEIVFGSFLHNLRVPFSGNILTAGSMVLLISAAFLWDGRGLFWRSALICAALKTLSPSAVIFGPMAAILAQGLILEAFVSLLGRTLPAFLLAAMMAMSWNLLQKILNYLIYYGQTLADIYSHLMEYARRQLQWQAELVWAPLLLLLAVYAFFGLGAGILGIQTGRRLAVLPRPTGPPPGEKTLQSPAPRKEFPYSIGFLVLNSLLFAGSFLLMARSNFSTWGLPVLFVIVFWAIRYRRALRQLRRPRLWITFVLFTFLSAWAFSWIPGNDVSLKQSLLIGLAMNERAILLILGLTVTGTELYHPVLRARLSKGPLRHVARGVRVAAETLPAIIQHIPHARTFRKNPERMLSGLFTLAGREVEKRIPPLSTLRKVYILTGSKGSGKTTSLLHLHQNLIRRGKKVTGFCAPRILTHGTTTGYRLLDLQTNKEYPLLRKVEQGEKNTVGRYSLQSEGYAAGLRILRSSADSTAGLIMIDEIGPLELRGKGWAPSLKKLLDTSGPPLLLAVREELAEQVIWQWNIHEATILGIDQLEKEPFSFR